MLKYWACPACGAAGSLRLKGSGLLQRGELKVSSELAHSLDGKPELIPSAPLCEGHDFSLWENGLALLHRLCHGLP